ncbi:hypothetical protein MTO96_009455 [Rhipicephalus appendiculatus]
MSLNWTAAFVTILYYWTVIYVGVWAGRKVHVHDERERRRHGGSVKTGARTPFLSSTAGDQYVRNLLVASRNLPLVLSCSSMTGNNTTTTPRLDTVHKTYATWVGGGYLNGTADAVFNYGLLYTYAPFGYSLSLLLGAFFFAGKMRLTDAVTMLDPFQRHYGRWMGLLLALPAVGSEVIWSAAILSALEGTASAINGVGNYIFVFASAVVTFIYTSLGGIYSVAYTDALQLFICILGMLVCLPFCLRTKFAGQVGPPHDDWMGSLPSSEWGQTTDVILMTALGGIPWQAYFQQVLSTPSPYNAKMLSFVGGLGSFALTLPPVIIAGAARGTNFTSAGYNGTFNLRPEDRASVLPFALYYMSPLWISIAGLLGITAAIMSSVDSSMLAASTLLTHNVYRTLIRPTASALETTVVFRFMVWTMGAAAVNVSIYVASVLKTWTLCSDMAYVLLFPQLLCVFYFRNITNAYGAVAAFVVGFVLRALCGEPSARIPVVLRFPNYDDVAGQRFPFRTFCMASSVVVLLLVSRLAAAAFRQALLPPTSDVFCCFQARLDADDSRMVALTDQERTMPSPGGVPLSGAVTPISRGRVKERKTTQSSPTMPPTATSPPETSALPCENRPGPSEEVAQSDLGDAGKTQSEPTEHVDKGPASTSGRESSGVSQKRRGELQEEREPAILSGDDGVGIKTAMKSSLRGSSSPLRSYSPRDGTTPTRRGGSRSKMPVVSSQDDAAAHGAKTPKFSATAFSASKPPATSASGTENLNYPLTLPSGRLGALQETHSRSALKGVGASKMAPQNHESRIDQFSTLIWASSTRTFIYITTCFALMEGGPRVTVVEKCLACSSGTRLDCLYIRFVR